MFKRLFKGVISQLLSKFVEHFHKTKTRCHLLNEELFFILLCHFISQVLPLRYLKKYLQLLP